MLKLTRFARLTVIPLLIVLTTVATSDIPPRTIPTMHAAAQSANPPAVSDVFVRFPSTLAANRRLPDRAWAIRFDNDQVLLWARDSADPAKRLQLRNDNNPPPWQPAARARLFAWLNCRGVSSSDLSACQVLSGPSLEESGSVGVGRYLQSSNGALSDGWPVSATYGSDDTLFALAASFWDGPLPSSLCSLPGGCGIRTLGPRNFSYTLSSGSITISYDVPTLNVRERADAPGVFDLGKVTETGVLHVAETFSQADRQIGTASYSGFNWRVTVELVSSDGSAVTRFSRMGLGLPSGLGRGAITRVNSDSDYAGQPYATYYEASSSAADLQITGLIGLGPHNTILYPMRTMQFTFAGSGPTNFPIYPDQSVTSLAPQEPLIFLSHYQNVISGTTDAHWLVYPDRLEDFGLTPNWRVRTPDYGFYGGVHVLTSLYLDEGTQAQPDGITYLFSSDVGETLPQRYLDARMYVSTAIGQAMNLQRAQPLGELMSDPGAQANLKIWHDAVLPGGNGGATVLDIHDTWGVGTGNVPSFIPTLQSDIVCDGTTTEPDFAPHFNLIGSADDHLFNWENLVDLYDRHGLSSAVHQAGSDPTAWYVEVPNVHQVVGTPPNCSLGNVPIRIYATKDPSSTNWTTMGLASDMRNVIAQLRTAGVRLVAVEKFLFPATDTFGQVSPDQPPQSGNISPIDGGEGSQLLRDHPDWILRGFGGQVTDQTREVVGLDSPAAQQYFADRAAEVAKTGYTVFQFWEGIGETHHNFVEVTPADWQARAQAPRFWQLWRDLQAQGLNVMLMDPNNFDLTFMNNFSKVYRDAEKNIAKGISIPPDRRFSDRYLEWAYPHTVFSAWEKSLPALINDPFTAPDATYPRSDSLRRFHGVVSAISYGLVPYNYSAQPDDVDAANRHYQSMIERWGLPDRLVLVNPRRVSVDPATGRHFDASTWDYGNGLRYDFDDVLWVYGQYPNETRVSYTSGQISGLPLPQISQIRIQPIAGGVVINWDTDVPSDSRIEYDDFAGQSPLVAVPAYAKAVGDAVLVTRHQVALLGRGFEQLYHFRIVSRGPAPAVTGDNTFTTGRVAATTYLPLVSRGAFTGR